MDDLFTQEKEQIIKSNFEDKDLKKIHTLKKNGSINASYFYANKDDLFILLKLYYAENNKKLEQIKEFDKFHTYFSGFNKNRENIYDIKGKKDGVSDRYFKFLSTSLAHRLFDQNIEFHFDNISKWNILKEKPNFLKEIKKIEKNFSVQIE